jgi:hypothetical protein
VNATSIVAGGVTGRRGYAPSSGATIPSNP